MDCIEQLPRKTTGFNTTSCTCPNSCVYGVRVYVVFYKHESEKFYRRNEMLIVVWFIALEFFSPEVAEIVLAFVFGLPALYFTVMLGIHGPNLNYPE